MDGLVRAVHVLQQLLERQHRVESSIATARSGLNRWSGSAVHDTVAGSLRYIHMYGHMLETSAASIGGAAWRAFEIPQLRLLMVASMYQLQQTGASRERIHRAINDSCTALGHDSLKSDVIVAVERASRSDARRSLSRASAYSLPSWLYLKLRESVGSQQLAGFAPSLLRRPDRLHLCVTPRLAAPDEYAAQLRFSTKCPATPIHFVPHGVTLLSRPRNITNLPGVKDRLAFVQDAAQQWCISQLSPVQPGQTMLDVCAAPGGKLRAAISRLPIGARIIAVEKSPRKVAALQREFSGMAGVEIVCGDASTPSAWWETRWGARHGSIRTIVLDAPCSATGILRTRPEVKSLQTPEGVAYLCGLQREMLRALWPKLQVEGELLYITCSLLHEENEAIIKSFLCETSDAEVVQMAMPAHGSVAKRSKYGVTFYPCDAHQGAFAAKLRRR